MNIRFGFALMFMVMLFGCSDHGIKSVSRTVKALKVGVSPVNSTYSYAGVVQARYDIPLAFQVPGKLATRNVDVGDVVKAKQLLATLDANDMAIQLQIREEKLSAAKSTLELAQAELNRYSPLFKKGYITASQLHQIRAKYESALADWQQSNGDVTEAQRKLAYTNLYSEDAGIIIDVSAEPGEVVAAGKPVLHIALSKEKEILIHVPEQRIEQWDQADNNIDVVLWAYPKTHYAAKVREISFDADPVTRTYDVKLSLPNADSKMKLGMTANVALVVHQKQPQIKIPLTAVFYQGKQAKVWVINQKNMVVQPVNITLGDFKNQDYIQVDSGLLDGQWVVTAGVHFLTPGQKVKLLSEN